MSARRPSGPTSSASPAHTDPAHADGGAGRAQATHPTDAAPTSPAPPARSTVLPGRQSPLLPTPGDHVVLGTPLDGPWPQGTEVVYLAGGCFWGMQKFLDQFDGVVETEVGYANGNGVEPTYQQVCRENTGHAETVKVLYDEAKLPLRRLLEHYFMAIDPFSRDHQGGDYGRQYRTGIYYTDPVQQEAIREACAAVEEKEGKALAVEVLPIDNFSRAEEFHQKYLDKNPGGYCHIPERLLKLK